MKYESDDLFHGIPVKIYSLKNPRIGGTIIRRILPSDIEPLERLFFRTVRQINVRDYTKEQVEAWAPANGDFDKWRKSFEGKSVFVSEEKSVVSGFCELEPNGHIDRFYVSADRIGQGLGRMMYQALEQEASVLKIRRLFAEASITAKPFFEKMGFTVVKEQVVNVKGIAMTNFVMEKKLPQP
ncbi:MAG: GNAT family N-acetyltransferase [Bdellovibrio sp.]|nr:MAG: GNAT family N-acetyltransferase [Bdellovibrio sp.]